MNTLIKKLTATATLIVPQSTATALVPLRTLTDLATDIRRSHAEYIDSVSRAADRAIKTGALLIEAKERVRKEYGHGFWETYVAETFPFTMRTAQNYMRQARQDAKHNQSVSSRNEDLSFLKVHKSVKIINAIEAKD